MVLLLLQTIRCCRQPLRGLAPGARLLERISNTGKLIGEDSFYQKISHFGTDSRTLLNI
jgi:hypothetical protein